MDTFEFIPLHRSLRAHEIYVDEKPRAEALQRLHERIEAGESPYDILGIEKQHSYYVEKFVKGLFPMTYADYGKIMNLDEEDVFDV